MPESKNIEELQYIKGIGPKRAKAFVEEDINTTIDLIHYYPKSYINRNALASIETLKKMLLQDSLFEEDAMNELNTGSEISIIGHISKMNERRIRGGKTMLSITVNDGTANCKILFWNMTAYFKKVYSIGQMLAISGKPNLSPKNDVTFTHPEIDIIEEEDEDLYNSTGILPKYRLTDKMRRSGITTRVMRKIINGLLESKLSDINEDLPDYFLEVNDLMGIQETIKNLHFPESYELLSKARYRIKFEEMFYFQLFLAIRQKNSKLIKKGPIIDTQSPSARKLYDTLPFELTGDQKKSIREIADDISSGKPMNRLLQGDVGSGKTIVAILAMLMAIDSGYQTAIMAPTEILAEQHFTSIKKYTDNIGIKSALLLGSQKASEKKANIKAISDGEAKIITGTHAMFQKDIKYHNLGMIIIDEQHRFGVAQRAELRNLAAESVQGSLEPHILIMSATPIPRTLSMTLYGDLNVSLIRQLPAKRKPIITKVRFDDARQKVYNFISEQVKNGCQAYIVYPLVEKSEKLNLKAATEQFEELNDEVFPDINCALLHGQMKWKEKEEIMHQFKEKKYDILISTTVIEVGIDVPNATIMMIENAERFGLSQLHQLRGRVGRGSEQSYCILMAPYGLKKKMRSKSTKEETITALARLKTMEKTNDGFEIAEADLKLRGPGDLIGTKQSGLPDFQYIDIVNDIEIIAKARIAAHEIAGRDRHLRYPANRIIKKRFLEKYSEESVFFHIS